MPALTQEPRYNPAGDRKPSSPPANVIAEIHAERKRQIEVEGWDADHDDEHTDFSMAAAAATYCWFSAQHDYDRRRIIQDAARDDNRTHRRPGFISILNLLWPISWGGWFKPKDRRRDLIRAGALIVAEIERLDRDAAEKAGRE